MKLISWYITICVHVIKVESAHAKLKRKLGSSQENFESLGINIHNLLELQHTSIKASFERCKTVVQQSFKLVEFKKLRGNVSISAMERILAETKHIGVVGVDSVACRCILRYTHGLPYAHEIAEYSKQGHPILLESVHAHWRKLDMHPTTIPITHDLDAAADMDLFLQRFNQSNQSTKL